MPRYPILTHDYAVQLELRQDDDESGDGRTLVGLAVPFDVELEVRDGWGWEPYTEVFRKGAFAKNLSDRPRSSTRNPYGVSLFLHHQHTQPPIGVASHLEESDRGLEAAFHLSATQLADDVLTLVRDEAMTGLSIGFEPRLQNNIPGPARNPPSALELVERTEVALREVSVCNYPAFEDAGVEAVRQSQGRHPTVAHLAAERERLRAATASAVDRYGRVDRRR